MSLIQIPIAARRLGCSRRTIYELVRRGILPAPTPPTPGGWSLDQLAAARLILSRRRADTHEARVEQGRRLGQARRRPAAEVQ